MRGWSSMTAVVLVYLGLLLAFVGVIATVKPVGPPGTHSRPRGVVVLLVGVAMAAAGSSLPAPEIRVGVPVSHLRIRFCLPVSRIPLHSHRCSGRSDLRRHQGSHAR